MTPGDATLNVLLAGDSEEVTLEIPRDPSREGGLTLRAAWEDETARGGQICPRSGAFSEDLRDR